MLRSNLCDYGDTYLVVKETIDLLAHDANDGAFKNNAPFGSCILKINSTLIDCFLSVLESYNV